jgi:hypothetical protein
MRVLALPLCLLLALPAMAETSFRVGATAAVPVPGTRLMIRLTDVTDQRCPADVTCFWEGMMRVELDLSLPDAPAAKVILCNLCEDSTRSATQGGVTLTLTGLDPTQAEQARLGRDVALADYTAILTATPAE